MSLVVLARFSAPVTLALFMTGLAIVFAFIRLVRGPTLPDRVVALDLIGVFAMGLIAAYDIAADQPVLLDAATVLALVAFLGTVAFSRFLERKASQQSGGESSLGVQPVAITEMPQAPNPEAHHE